MKHVFVVLGLVACLALGVSASVSLAPPASASAPEADGAAQVERFIQRVLDLEAAFQAGDVDRIVAYYADDAISLPPGFPASVGRAAISADLHAMYDAYSLQREFELVSVEVAGNYATRYGEWTQTWTPLAGGDSITETGRCVLGWKRVNGEWMVAWEIWNTY